MRSAVRIRPAAPKKPPFSLIVPIGTFSEPCELSGTQADSGSCPPVVFYASNRLISSISVICFVMCGACSPSCIGLSTLPMSRYTILILCPAEREYFWLRSPTSIRWMKSRSSSGVSSSMVVYRLAFSMKASTLAAEALSTD